MYLALMNRAKNNDRQCKLCGNECESVDSIRNTFMVELENPLGGVLRSLVHSII